MRKMNNYQSSLKEQYVEELAIGDVFRFVFFREQFISCKLCYGGSEYLNVNTCGGILGVIDKWDDDVHLYRVIIESLQEVPRK